MITSRIHPVVFGGLGLIPFAALAIGVYVSPPNAPLLLKALLLYGATILAFLGGIHWGVAVTANNAPTYLYVSGVIPQLLGFGALLAPDFVGLLLLVAGLMAMLALDLAYQRAQLLPKWFLRLRLVLSFGATACLCSVLPAVSRL